MMSHNLMIFHGSSDFPVLCLSIIVFLTKNICIEKKVLLVQFVLKINGAVQKTTSYFYFKILGVEKRHGLIQTTSLFETLIYNISHIQSKTDTQYKLTTLAYIINIIIL